MASKPGTPGVGGPYLGLPVGYQQISASTLAAATALTVPPGAAYALIQSDTAGVRWRDDGTAPTSSVGMQMFASAIPFLYAGNLAQIQFIAASGSPILNISYYR